MAKEKKDESFMVKLATLIVDKRKGFYLVFIVLCVFSVLCMNKVKVNNDLTTYLPDTTETRRGLTRMDEQFITYGSARILVCNITYDEAEKLSEKIKELPGVKNASVSFMAQKMLLEADDDVFDDVLKAAVKTAKKVEPDFEIEL